MVSCVPVTLGTPCIEVAHLVRKWRVCSNTSGFPLMLSPPLPFRATYFPLSLTLKCKLCLSSLHPEVTELRPCLRKGTEMMDASSHKAREKGRNKGRKEKRREGG